MHMHAIVPNQRTSDLAISYVIFFRVEKNKVGLNCHRLIILRLLQCSSPIFRIYPLEVFQTLILTFIYLV